MDGFSWSTAHGYRSYLSKHVRPRWGSTAIADMKALKVSEWLKSLHFQLRPVGHVGALLHLLFERAMLWELMDVQRNPDGACEG